MDRGGARCPCDGTQPTRRDGPLLRRDARHLFGPDAAVREFGGHIEMVEVDELAALRREVTPDDIAARRWQSFRRYSTSQPDCPQTEFERAARTSVALDRLVGVTIWDRWLTTIRATGRRRK